MTDVQVKRSIRNLVQLNTYEKPFRPEIAGGVREMLFNQQTSGFQDDCKKDRRCY